MNPSDEILHLAALVDYDLKSELMPKRIDLSNFVAAIMMFLDNNQHKQSDDFE